MKKYVLTVSKKFLANHPKHGQDTNFAEKILNGEKIHTIRTNYEYWNKIVKQVNSGKAMLCIRQWSEKPYRSKQIEVTNLTKLGIQRIEVDANGGTFTELIAVDNNTYTEQIKGYSLNELSKNDGLSFDDFKAWFPKKTEAAIIHFTDFLYK